MLLLSALVYSTCSPVSDLVRFFAYHLLLENKIFTWSTSPPRKKYFFFGLGTKIILSEMSFRTTILKDRFSQSGLSFLWKPRTFGDNVFKFLHYLSLLMLALSSLVYHIFSQKCFHFFQSVPLPSRFSGFVASV